MTLRLRFGAPRSNWIPLGLASESIAFDELVSCIPHDPLDGIARAALAAAEGRHGACVLRAGPDAYTLAFSPAERRVLLEIVRRPDAEPAARGALVFRKRGTPQEVLLPVWRGLRELGRRWPDRPETWALPFPERAVADLGGRLGAA